MLQGGFSVPRKLQCTSKALVLQEGSIASWKLQCSKEAPVIEGLSVLRLQCDKETFSTPRKVQCPKDTSVLQGSFSALPKEALVV